MTLNMVVGALEFVMTELHVQTTFPPPTSFLVGSWFLVTYFHNGYLFSLACFLAVAGLFAAARKEAKENNYWLKKLGMAYLKSWVHNYWLPEISKIPHIKLLTKGWFTFVLSSTTDLDWALKKVWSIVVTLTLLKCWTPTFDVKCERVDEEPIWVKLLGLLMQY
jgi:hypothetical protein